MILHEKFSACNFWGLDKSFSFGLRFKDGFEAKLKKNHRTLDVKPYLVYIHICTS